MKPVISPNKGLYLDRPAIAQMPGALQDGLNFRVKFGTVQSLNLGWTRFSTEWELLGPVMLIDNFFPRNAEEKLIFGDDHDLYEYDALNDTVLFLTPRYSTGTVTGAGTGTGVTGSGTTWVGNVDVGDEISFGSNAIRDPFRTGNDRWIEIAEVTNNTTLVLAESRGFTVAPGTDYTIRKRFFMGAFDVWDYDVFVNDGVSGDDLWIATNGADWVISWNGTDTQVTLNSQMGFTCKTVAAYSNMMIYGNVSDGLTDFPSSIINSDIGKPLVAGDVGTGLSEQFRVHDGSDGILNMVTLGDYLVIYSARHITPMQFIGDPLVFQFRASVVGFGPQGPRATADYGDFHTFVGPDGMYQFDGVTLRETMAHVWRETVRTMDPVRKQRLFSHFDEEQADLIWSTPLNTDAETGSSIGSSELALSEHYMEDVGELDPPYSRRQFPFTASGYYERTTGTRWQDLAEAWSTQNYAWDDQFYQSAFPLNLVGNSLGEVFTLNTDQQGDGAILPSFVKFGRVAIASGRERGLVKRVYPFFRQIPANLVQVTVYVTDHASTPSVETGPYTFDTTQPFGGHFVTVFRRGRFFEVQFGSSLGDPWVLEGYDLDVISGGRR